MSFEQFVEEVQVLGRDLVEKVKALRAEVEGLTSGIRDMHGAASEDAAKLHKLAADPASEPTTENRVSQNRRRRAIDRRRSVH